MGEEQGLESEKTETNITTPDVAVNVESTGGGEKESTISTPTSEPQSEQHETD